jgi:hypothetical protein
VRVKRSRTEDGFPCLAMCLGHVSHNISTDMAVSDI